MKSKLISRGSLFLGLILMLASILPLAGCGGSDSTPVTSWSFAVLCDSRSSYASDPAGITSPYYNDNGTSPYFANVAKALSREKGLDFVLFPGDLVRGKKPTLTGAQMTDDLNAWNAYMKPVIDAKLPVYYIRGNHDASEISDPTGALGNVTAIWKKFIAALGLGPDTITQDTNTAQNTLSYAFMHKGSLFVGLDEYVVDTVTNLSYDQAFLNAQLARQADRKFIFMHQPVWNYKADELAPNASTLADDLNKGKVDAYFSGHVHSYQRIAKTGYGFQELILGTAGAPQDYPTLTSTDPANVGTQNITVNNFAGGANADARFGYAIVTVYSNGMVTSVVKFLDRPDDPNSSMTLFDPATIAAAK